MIEDNNIPDMDNLSLPQQDSKDPPKYNFTQEEVVEAIQYALGYSPLIKKTNMLITTVYRIMMTLFVEDKKAVVIEAPTGSGKTVIAFITNIAINYLFQKKENSRPEFFADSLSYYLTSSKILQDQVEHDIPRFGLENMLKILKGIKNYECLNATHHKIVMDCKFNGMSPEEYRNSKDFQFVDYSERSCKGLKMKEIEIKYDECYGECPYMNARYEASWKNCAVLNYAYFLTVMKAGFNPFFGTRRLTICDEAHLLPDIVCNLFSWELTNSISNRLSNILQEMDMINPDSQIHELSLKSMYLGDVFRSDINRASQISKYAKDLLQWYQTCQALKKRYFTISDNPNERPEFFFPDKLTIKFNTFFEDFEMYCVTINDLIALIDKRPEDVFFESSKTETAKNSGDFLSGNYVYKHTIRDLSEADLVRKNFVDKCDKILFMSATLGNPNEFGVLCGLKPDEFEAFCLPSTFDFSKSPIYRTFSGSLIRKNFDLNIDKVLMDCIKIMDELHPNEKGIVHTATFKISDLLKEKINLLSTNPERFLFYRSTKEKEEQIEKLRKSTKPLVIIGPSLQEGLDLKDDLGRFNILVKVPYANLSGYIQRKIQRFPFWYERNTIQTIVQSIGRTNRHVNDYSTVYLLDNTFENLIYKLDVTGDTFLSRFKKLKL